MLGINTNVASIIAQNTMPSAARQQQPEQQQQQK